MMAWHWDQAVRSSHGVHGACLVFVGCPIKRAISRSSKVYVHSQKIEKVEKEAEWACGAYVRAGSARRGVAAEDQSLVSYA